MQIRCKIDGIGNSKFAMEIQPSFVAIRHKTCLNRQAPSFSLVLFENTTNRRHLVFKFRLNLICLSQRICNEINQKIYKTSLV
ncbi:MULTISPECIES: hypothetical protein [unclassified Campylobacter]|uniref:hypothetical protein n=1 Tax=unclassified Campylobacter TaxID=2593542 RepID=UPI0022E9FF56|nr:MULTISPECIES: hypothetical protein [unclassified Campylobacter]MDA3080194.1 hypothetical protein [Campylobacter sp. CS_NA2]MDA3081585.1 hypothetical protein [Campylobacter sp. CS_NA1]MDA3086251.1 hypothetical protein [Campylobacter sp. CS_ED1]MDA3090801.1 hypothetical protein [Campylobacter sp. CS_ED2]